jgi:hypothetical protein
MPTSPSLPFPHMKPLPNVHPSIRRSLHPPPLPDKRQVLLGQPGQRKRFPGASAGLQRLELDGEEGSAYCHRRMVQEVERDEYSEHVGAVSAAVYRVEYS